MNDDDQHPPPDGDSAVGYGHPPKHTRFQPGRSGNPRGRPKSRRTIDKMLHDALSRKVSIQEGVKRKMLSLEEVIIWRLTNVAAKGDLKATKLIFELKSQYAGSPDTDIDMKALSAEDREIFSTFFAGQNPSATPSIDRDLGGTT